jgi:hypothetical protein
MDYVIKKTSVWGDHYKSRSIHTKRRLYEKCKLLQPGYPIIDHYTIYAYKPKSQRGPPKESQTFIVSYAYNYDHFIENRETEFIHKVESIQLRFHKEPCIFREKDAYRILIMDTDVNLNEVLRLIPIN